MPTKTEKDLMVEMSHSRYRTGRIRKKLPIRTMIEKPQWQRCLVLYSFLSHCAIISKML